MWISIGIIVGWCAVYTFILVRMARAGKTEVPHTSSGPGGLAHFRIAIEYRKRPWRAWAYTVEHSTDRLTGGRNWYVWKQGYASTYSAARRKARRGVTPPYGVPQREEYVIVRDFVPGRQTDRKSRPDRLVEAKHLDEAA